MEELLHELLHALLDTINVFLVIFLLYILLSFIEDKITKKFEKSSKFSPIYGALIGIIPQCGFSIVSSDLYRKKNISLGTLLAVFIVCSDEAIPIFLSHPDKALSIIPLLIIKLITAIIFGYLIDFILLKHQEIKERKIHNHESNIIHKGCCHNHIHEEKENKLHKHLIDPLFHSLKIIIYVFIVNVIFALLIYFIGEENIANFLNANVYLTPLLSSIIGLIPNCASSVIISELYINNTLTFAATMSGLICNAGLGLVYLYKDKSKIKNSLLITLLLFLIANFVGYLLLFIL